MENIDIPDDNKPSKQSKDLAVIAALSIAAFIASAYFDALETIVAFVHRHEDLELDEFLAVSMMLVIVMTFYAVRRWRELAVLNRTIKRKNRDLLQAFGEIKQLKGILPICASCKKIRDDAGYWHQVEVYVGNHTAAEFSHSICPECMKKLYPDLVKG
jgi:hypothetical protein